MKTYEIYIKEDFGWVTIFRTKRFDEAETMLSTIINTFTDVDWNYVSTICPRGEY